MDTQGIAIGELSRLTGCNIETVRYYERIRLLPTPSRIGTYRRYATEDVERLSFVRRARDLGFTLDEVRALLSFAAGGRESCGDVRTIAGAHLVDVQRKIADLKIMERALRQSIRQCDEGEMSGCPLITALYANR